MVLIKIYPKDTEMYLWSQTSAEGAEDFQATIAALAFRYQLRPAGTPP